MKFITTDFGMSFFIEIDCAILMTTALNSNPIAPFFGNTICENEPFSSCCTCLLNILFSFSFVWNFYRLSVFKNPYIEKCLLVWNSKLSCTDIKLLCLMYHEISRFFLLIYENFVHQLCWYISDFILS